MDPVKNIKTGQVHEPVKIIQMQASIVKKVQNHKPKVALANADDIDADMDMNIDNDQVHPKPMLNFSLFETDKPPYQNTWKSYPQTDAQLS